MKCFTGYIEFGTNQALIEREANRLLMEHQVDLLVVFADYPMVSCLFPLLKALDKLLVVVNQGAQYPATWEAQPNVIHHNLGNALCCWLTGKLAAKENGAAAFVSSYYDGGYSNSHALYQSFVNEQGLVNFNLVGAQYKDQFNMQPLLNYLQNSTAGLAILTLLSGELVPEFFAQLAPYFRTQPGTQFNTQDGPQLSERQLQLYSSPVLLEEFMLLEEVPANINISGYTSWYSGLDNQENQLFCRQFKSDTSREPDSFAVLGWDTGILLQAISKIAAGGKIEARTITQQPSLRQLNVAKGTMELHPQTHYYLSPVHYLTESGAGKVSLQHTLSREAVKTSFSELINQPIQGVSSQWLNTYLCS